MKCNFHYEYITAKLVSSCLFHYIKTLVTSLRFTSLHSTYFSLVYLMSACHLALLILSTSTCHTTDSQSASPSWCKAPIWDLRPIFPLLSLIIFLDSLLMCRVLSNEKLGLQFSVFAGHRQRSLSQVWVPRDSWAYFIVSIFLRLPQTWRARFLYLFPPGTG
jgi:hypothetical protein